MILFITIACRFWCESYLVGVPVRKVAKTTDFVLLSAKSYLKSQFSELIVYSAEVYPPIFCLDFVTLHTHMFKNIGKYT